MRQNLINDGHAVEMLGKEINNEKLKYLYNKVLHSSQGASYILGRNQVNYKGENIGKSLIDILNPIKDTEHFTTNKRVTTDSEREWLQLPVQSDSSNSFYNPIIFKNKENAIVNKEKESTY